MKNVLFILMFLSFAATAQAHTIDCFLVKEGEKNLIKEGKNCDTAYSPASTFKVPLALMGYESGILKDENHPIWKNSVPVTFLKEFHAGEKTPSSWMRFSIVWYSQILTEKLGMKRFQSYVDQLDYGNKDLSGNTGKNDGLTQSWLSSSLKISPNQQLDFIEKLATNKLSFSQQAQMQTKNLARLFEESLLSNGWSLYGKTGTDVDRQTEERRGYFVGFGTKENRLITFVAHISGDKNLKFAGVAAKKVAMDEMMKEILRQ